MPREEQASFPEQIRWCISELETDAGRVPGGDSTPIEREFTRTPGHEGYTNTSGRDFVRHLNRRGRFQRTRDADTGPARLLGQTVHTPARRAARRSEAWWRSW